MANDNWLDAARNAVRADASVAYFMCQETAGKERVNLWWVLEEFKKEFERLAKKDSGG